MRFIVTAVLMALRPSWSMAGEGHGGSRSGSPISPRRVPASAGSGSSLLARAPLTHANQQPPDAHGLRVRLRK